MTKQLRDLEAELDEERKQKTAAMTIKKVNLKKNNFTKYFICLIIISFLFSSKQKLEGDIKDFEASMDMNNKVKDDALKQLKKHQGM